MPSKKTSQNGLLISKSSLLLREKWFTRNKFLTGIAISDIKYNYLRL